MNQTELFQKAADKLHADFEESRVVPHAGVKGGEAEKLVRKFLNDHLPGRFRAGSGFIVDRKDTVSRQTDVIIYDALNCPVYRVSEEGGVYPSDNVAGVVEVKSSLNKAELDNAWEKVASVKALHKTPEPDMGSFITTNTLGLVFGSMSKVSKRRQTDSAAISQHVRFVRSRGSIPTLAVQCARLERIDRSYRRLPGHHCEESSHCG